MTILTRRCRNALLALDLKGSPAWDPVGDPETVLPGFRAGWKVTTAWLYGTLQAGHWNERMIEIRAAEFPRDLSEVRSLFREYANGLEVDLDFQDFEGELAGLPGKYAPPTGRLLLAWSGTAPVGCVALRPLDKISCEMKRLYVRPQARGEQLGRRLVQRICEAAREGGYSRICLDTLPTMSSAQKLYQSFGFAPIDPYVFNPIPETQFLALDLTAR